VIQGSVLVALFAILTDMLFARLDHRLRRHRGS
jgi:ABC-type proline/glycine betaine transport system permease subunit